MLFVGDEGRPDTELDGRRGGDEGPAAVFCRLFCLAV